jgi:hypothetical protein
MLGFVETRKVDNLIAFGEGGMIFKHFPLSPQKRNELLLSRRFHFPIEPFEVQLLKQGRRGDPITTAVMTAIIGTAAVGGGAAAGIAGLSGAFDSGDEENGGQQQASNYTPVSEDTGAVTTVESVETQAAQRRLARLSKYFTSPTGVLDTPTGTTGVF